MPTNAVPPAGGTGRAATARPPMTARQRFAVTMAGGCPDRVPLFDEGLRDEVVAAWQQQGLPPGTDPRSLVACDLREAIPADLEPRPRLTAWPRSRRALLGELRRRLDPADPERLPADWSQRVRAWRDREHILQLAIHRGFFLTLGVNDWQRLSEALCLLADRPTLVSEVLEIQAEFCAALAGRILRDVQPDFVTFSEPIGGNHGPLVSPRTYRDLILPHGRTLLAALRRGGVRTVVYLTYANTRPLLPAVVEAGFDCLWACETEPRAMGYRAIRRQFGPSLGLIGGIDLDALLRSPSRLRRHLDAVVPPLLAQGRYVPVADGRVRANIPFGHYLRYHQLLEERVR